MQCFALLLRAMFFCTILPSSALAGAWLRAEGAGFLSFSVTLDDLQDWGTPDGFGAFYGEYGLSPDLTLGLDLGTDENGKAKAFGFVVLPISREALLINLELGAGVNADDPALRPGVSLGRAVTVAGLGGWFSVDARAIVTEDRGAVFATDTTLGLITGKRMKMFMQLQQGGPLSDPDWLRVATSVVWQVAPAQHLELGTTTGIFGADSFGIKLGLWHDF